MVANFAKPIKFCQKTHILYDGTLLEVKLFDQMATI